MSFRSIRLLRLLTPLSAIASSVAQTIALLSNEWLHSIELMTNKDYEKFTMHPDMEYHEKITVSGLWQLCHNDPPNRLMHCFIIDYFSKDEYSPDPNDSTMALPYAAKRAAIFIFISSVILIIGELLCFLGHVCSRKRVLTFAAGIAFILSGTFAIFLYIRQHQLEYKSEIERQQCVDYFSPQCAPMEPQSFFCMRHGSRGRRYSRTRELSRDASPCPLPMKGSRHGSLNVPNIPLSDSMRDLTYFNFPPFSRETTCNTVSTAVDINREASRELVIRDYPRDYSKEFLPRTESAFTYESTLTRRTTPV